MNCKTCGIEMPPDEFGVFDWRSGKYDVAAPTCFECFKQSVNDLCDAIDAADAISAQGVFIYGMARFGETRLASNDVWTLKGVE